MASATSCRWTASRRSRARQAARISGDYEAAKTLCLEALGHLDHGADPRRAARLYERLGRYHFHRFDSALAAYIDAQRLLPEGRTAQRARLLGDEALTLSFMARFEEARDRAREAIAIAQEASASEEEGAARVVLGTALAFLGDPVGGERELRDGLRLASEAGNPEDIGRGYMDLGEVMRIEGRFDAALEAMREGEAVVERYGLQDSDGSFMAVNAAEDLLRLGRWEEARAQLDELSRRRLGPTGKVLYESVAGRLDVACGRFDEAEAEFERVREFWQPGGPTEALPALYQAGPRRRCGAGTRRARASASARASRRSERRSTRSTCPCCSTSVLVPRPTPGTRPRSPSSCSSSSRSCCASTASAGSSRRTRRLTWRPAAPRSPGRAASPRRSCGRRRRAPGARRPALPGRLRGVARGRGAPARRPPARRGQRAAAGRGGGGRAARREPLRQRVLRLAEWGRLDVGERAPEAPAAAPAPAGLTARELQVLRLLAEGMTDREIAERLVISVKTASHHVSHILGKLNARGRVRRPAEAEQLGLLEPP